MAATVKSSVESDVFASLALLAISLGTILLLRHFLPLRSTPGFLLVPVFLALALPASLIILVPIDLASISRSQSDGFSGIWLPERVIVVSWRITYWLTFALTWYAKPNSSFAIKVSPFMAISQTNSKIGLFFPFSANI
jgi:hypothetical protein